MVGQLDSAQDKLFYSFNLDNYVPRTHLCKGFVNFSTLRRKDGRKEHRSESVGRISGDFGDFAPRTSRAASCLR